MGKSGAKHPYTVCNTCGNADTLTSIGVVRVFVRVELDGLLPVGL